MDEENAIGRTEANLYHEAGDPESRSVRIEVAKQKLQNHREVLERLRAWRDWEKSCQSSLRLFLLSKVYPKRPPCPPKEELQSLAEYFFPPRPWLNVSICDFDNGGCERHNINIEKLPSCEPRTQDRNQLVA